MKHRHLIAGLAVAAAAFAAVPAASASRASACPVPGDHFRRVAPEAMGMDAAKLRSAIDYGTSNLGFAVRVYRRGCLVGEDRLASVNDKQTFESYSMSKSVVSLLFGRAMTLGFISPDDPVGSLVPQADRAHGEITMRDLLTMTSGSEWNGLRDYNIFTMPDRVRDALTLPIVHEPGTYFEYAQSPVALLVRAISRAVGEDPEKFLQRELLDHLGIAAGSWKWQRDKAGNIQGFYGAQMTPGDFARLGELLRRGGRWDGKRLLSRAYLDQALTASPTNGCYGWLIWLNSAAPCIGATIANRPIETGRDFPTLPADMYDFSGLFGQRVTVFPTQRVMVVRLGQDPGLVFDAGENWETGLYRRVLAAITDERVPTPGPAKPTHDEPEADYGFQTALLHPDQYDKGVVQGPLPAAGPPRARAPQLAQLRAPAKHAVRVRLSCPRRWPGRSLGHCAGRALLGGAGADVKYSQRRYSIPAGKSRTLTFAVPASNPRGGLAVTAKNRDQAGGTAAVLRLRLK